MYAQMDLHGQINRFSSPEQDYLYDDYTSERVDTSTAISSYKSDVDISSHYYTDSDEEVNKNGDLMMDISDTEKAKNRNARRTRRHIDQINSRSRSHSRKGRRRQRNHHESQRFAQSAGTASVHRESSHCGNRVSTSVFNVNVTSSALDRISVSEELIQAGFTPAAGIHHPWTSTPVQSADDNNRSCGNLDHTYINVNVDDPRIYTRAKKAHDHTYENLQEIVSLSRRFSLKRFLLNLRDEKESDSAECSGQ